MYNKELFGQVLQKPELYLYYTKLLNVLQLDKKKYICIIKNQVLKVIKIVILNMKKQNSTRSG